MILWTATQQVSVLELVDECHVSSVVSSPKVLASIQRERRLVGPVLVSRLNKKTILIEKDNFLKVDAECM